MQNMDVIDNIDLMPDLKKDPMMVMVSTAEKELFKEAAAKDERGLSDWIRYLARNRARELGLEIKEPGVKARKVSKKA